MINYLFLFFGLLIIFISLSIYIMTHDINVKLHCGGIVNIGNIFIYIGVFLQCSKSINAIYCIVLLLLLLFFTSYSSSALAHSVKIKDLENNVKK